MYEGAVRFRGIPVIPLGGWGWVGMGWWKMMKSMGISKGLQEVDDGMKEMTTYYLKCKANIVFFCLRLHLFFFVRIDNQQFLGG